MNKFSISGIALACTLACVPFPRAISQNAAAENPQALLDEAKKSRVERKQAAMQKELNRLSEDEEKAKQEMADLEKSISKVGNAVAGAKSQGDQLAGRKKRVLQDLELLPLRIDAMNLKTEALTLLNGAHAKAMEALTRHREELELKSALVAAELQKLSSSDTAPTPDSPKRKAETDSPLAELRRNLAKAAEKSSLADNRAREAMEIASRKLQQADAAVVKAEKKQAEIDVANDPNAPAAAEQPSRSKSRKNR